MPHTQAHEHPNHPAAHHSESKVLLPIAAATRSTGVLLGEVESVVNQRGEFRPNAWNWLSGDDTHAAKQPYNHRTGQLSWGRKVRGNPQSSDT